MIYAGLKLTPEEIHLGGKRSIPIYIVTYVAMLFLTLPFTGYTISTDNLLIVASILAVASAPIVVRFTRFFGQELLHVALSYAVISEVGSLVILYLLINFELHHLSCTELFLELVKDIVFLGTVLGLNYFTGIQHKVWIMRALRKLKSDEAVFGVVMILATSLALISEQIGLHFSIGAFLVGLVIHSDLVGTKQYERLHTIISGVTLWNFCSNLLCMEGHKF